MRGDVLRNQLALRMRAYAAKNPGNDHLIALADKMDEAAAADPWDVRKVLGSWARARRAWCEATGEGLI